MYQCFLQCVLYYSSMKEEYKFVYNTLVRSCDNMLHLLQKATDHAVTNGNEEDLLEGRLASDMFTFKRQVQIFSDNVAGGVARVYGVEKPSMPDTETSLAELIKRIEVTREFASTINPERVEGIDGRKIKLAWMPAGMYFEAGTYLKNFILQNTLFHLVTAYDILRHKGVQIGKQDFLGQIEMKQE